MKLFKVLKNLDRFFDFYDLYDGILNDRYTFTSLSKDSLDILLKLDEFGICASAGSACSTGDSLPSHVLTAIGLNAEEASGTIRFSLGKENTKDEIDYVVNKLSYI